MFFGLTSKKLPFPVPHRGHMVRDFTLRKLFYGHESETFEFFKRKLNKNDVVADIGAHNGEYATFFSDYAKEVRAYEPDKVAFRKLQRATNKLSNVYCINEAIGNTNGVAKLGGEAGSGLNSLLYGENKVEVFVTKLPDKFTWAKIDVEGAELQVLEGLSKKINCTVEFSPKNLRMINISPDVFLSRIEELGYEWYAIDKNGMEVKTDLETLLKNTRGHCNLYLEPK